MNVDLKKNKQILREFMRKQYTDERLIALLGSARSGGLRYASCCCFVGMTEEHVYGHDTALRARYVVPGYGAAEDAFLFLAQHVRVRDEPPDRERRRILVPMILTELKRRNRAPRSEQNKTLENEHASAVG